MSLSWLRPPRRALVVGIDAYDAPNTLIPDLGGCVADALAVYDLLTGALGMPALEVRLLTSPPSPAGAAATRAAILEGFGEFLGGAPEGSELLFYYSGHGSYTALDPQIAFGDKRGETIVPADARVGGVLDILDRELRILRAGFAAKNLRLTVVADSCFSGDVMRGEPDRVGDMVPRMVSQPHAPPRTFETLLDGNSGLSLADLEALYAAEDDSYSLVSGCLPTQQSYEGPVGDGRRGIMTTALLSALDALHAPVTYAELGRVLPAFLSPAQLAKQLPNVTGDVERGLFGAPVPLRALPLFTIQDVDDGQRIRIRAGLIAGLEPGSELRGYTDWSLASETGTWKVVEAGAHSAVADPIESVAMPRAGQPLTLLTRSGRPSVFFDPLVRAVQAAWYDDKKVGPPALVETADRQDAGYVVTVDQDEFVARRRDGTVRPSLRRARTDVRAPHDLARQLNRVAAWESFVSRRPAAGENWQLPPLNDPGGISLTVEWLDWDGAATPLQAGGAGVLTAGSRLRLTVGNGAERDAWIALYLLDEAFFVAERLFPADSTFLLQPGTSRTAPWQNGDWGGGLLSLMLLVSSSEITAADAPRYPLGARDPMRGAGASRGLHVVTEDSEPGPGWAVLQVAYGL